MNNIFQNYPYTNFHEMNLDFIMDLCAKSLGLHLVWSDKDTLMLCAADGTTISDITINRSNKAIKDDDGNVITSYYIHAVGAENDAIVVTYGDGTKQVITIPYADKAKTDVNGKELTSYVAKVCFQNDALVVYDGTGAEIYRAFTPYAIRALNDNEDHKIDQHYVHKITSTAGEDDLTVYDGNDLEMFKVTVDFATRALNDYTGNAIRQHYVHDSYTDTKQEAGKIHFTNAEGDVIAEYTVGYAQMAKYDVTGEEFRDEYAHDLQPDTKTITLYNDKGVGLSTITVPYATMAEYIQDGVTRIDSAVADIVVDGKELAISYLDKTGKKITVNYSVHAEQDMLDNLITATYVAKVYNNTETGELVFYAANGDIIAQLRPVVTSAVNDNTGKKITSYVHTVTVADNSKYVTITHGDGVVELIEVPYATKALEDTYGNVIGNDYAFSFDTIVDETIRPEVGSNVIKVVNGEGQEIRRVVINNVQYAKTCGKVIGMVLNDLTDVDTTGVADKQTLVYDSASATWKPGTAAGGGGSQRRVTINKNEFLAMYPGTEHAVDQLPYIYGFDNLVSSKTVAHEFYHKTYDRLAGYGETHCQLYTEWDCVAIDTSKTIDYFLGYADFGCNVPGAVRADFIDQAFRVPNRYYPSGYSHDDTTGLWTINDMEALTDGTSVYRNNYYQVPDDCTKIQYDVHGVPTNVGPMPVNCNLCVAVYDLSDNSLVFLRAGIPLLKTPAHQDTMLYGTTVLKGAADETTLPANFKICFGLCYTGPYAVRYELVNDIPELVFPSDTSGGDTDSGSTDSGSTDSGSTDSGSTDSGSTDSGSTDSGSTDSGDSSGGSTDSGSTDSGSTDSGDSSGGSTDSGSTDSGSTDSGSTDSGSTDSGSTDIDSTTLNELAGYYNKSVIDDYSQVDVTSLANYYNVPYISDNAPSLTQTFKWDSINNKWIYQIAYTVKNNLTDSNGDVLTTYYPNYTTCVVDLTPLASMVANGNDYLDVYIGVECDRAATPTTYNVTYQDVTYDVSPTPSEIAASYIKVTKASGKYVMSVYDSNLTLISNMHSK